MTPGATGRFRARYRIETPYPLDEATSALANEQSTGTFVDVPAETEELQARHAARVEEVDELDPVSEPSLPGAATPKGTADSESYRRAEVVVSFPSENVGDSLPTLLTTVGGNLFELRQFSGIRLLDVEIPEAIVDSYPGPQFGVDGTRELVGVDDRPLIGTIVKPNVGLTPEETADVVAELLPAGIDFVKDDELLASPPYSPVADRVSEVMAEIDAHRDRTGETVMYACNITGDLPEMLERHDTVVEAGGNCVMVSMNSVGLSALTELRRHADVPVHGHRNGWGALSRCRQLGFDFEAYHKFFRLAGVDHLHVNGIRNKFCESDESVIGSARAVQTPIANEDDVAMPVFSSGQWADQARDTYEALGNTDLLYLAGGGILGHPDGPAAGVAHLKQAWEAATNGIPLREYAEDHEALRTALNHYERR